MVTGEEGERLAAINLVLTFKLKMTQGYYELMPICLIVIETFIICTTH